MAGISKIQGISFIAPFNHLEYAYQNSDFSMVLTHLVLGSQAYREFYAKTEKPILLDNSFFELGRCLSKDEVYEAAKQVNATCVVLTDGSLDELDFYKKKGYEVMYVPLTLEDLKSALKNKSINKIGISCISSQKMIGKQPFEPARTELLMQVRELITNHNYSKLHFLGATNAQLQDLYDARTEHLIGSIDTSLPIWAGLHKQALSATSPRYKEHCDFESELPWQPEVSANIVAYRQCFYYGILQPELIPYKLEPNGGVR